MIPAPPFADHAEARLFLKQLSIYLAALDRGNVTLPTFLLLSTLDRIHGSIRRLPDDASPVHLPQEVLHLAVLSRFPVPWTPQGLQAAKRAGDDWALAVPSTATEFVDAGDPTITARRGADGWTIIHSERGTDRILHAGLTDDEYVQVLLDDERGHPFPYGWRSHDVDGFAEVVSAATHVRDQWDAGFGRLPYLTNWIDERDAAL